MIQLDLKVYKSHVKPTWCPGCGDYGLLSATQKALLELQIPPHQVCIISGIGCSSNFPHFLSAYGFHSIHGRVLPIALGVHLANHEITTIAVGGDGDGYGIGAGHFVHACRRNLDITYMVMNNEIYGLTTGQASPTTMEGTATKSTPAPDYTVHERPFNPLAVALANGATFVARGFSGDAKHLKDLIVKAIKHRGFALIDVLSPCVTYQKVATYDFFREKVYKLEDINHDPSDFSQAMARAMEWDKLPIGVFYQVDRPTYEDFEPALKHGPLVKQKGGLKNGDPILKQFY